MASRTKKRAPVSTHSTPRPWTLPAKGSLQPFLENHLAALRDDGQRMAYSQAALLADVDEMLESEAADIQGFKAQQAPVTARHFELLRVFITELNKLGASRRLQAGNTQTVAANVEAAMKRVLRARTDVANRAAANNLSRAPYDVRRAVGSPHSLYRAATEVVAAAQEELLPVDNTAYVRKLVTELKDATDALGQVAGLRKALGKERGGTHKRKRLLTRTLYEYAVWLSGWGRAMAGDDPEAQRRWRLDKLFPNQERTKAAATDEEAVRAATADPPET